MMRGLWTSSIALLLTVSIGSAEPFQEITVGGPVSSITDAQAWYINFFGADAEAITPVPGVEETKVTPDVWF